MERAKRRLLEELRSRNHMCILPRISPSRILAGRSQDMRDGSEETRYINEKPLRGVCWVAPMSYGAFMSYATNRQNIQFHQNKMNTDEYRN